MGSDKHADRQTEQGSRQRVITGHVSHRGCAFRGIQVP